VTVHSPLASPRATIDRLTEWGISTRKSLGQHFLIDDGVVGRILRLASLGADDVVLEVGPGIGTLTEALLSTGATVIAVEKDDTLLPALADIETRYPGRFTLVHADALDLLETDAPASAPAPAVRTAPAPAPAVRTTPAPAPAVRVASTLVANLPYAVAATIVLDCFQRLPSIQSATVMVQREVAERMTAQPGSKAYGAYTVKLRLLAQTGASFAVSRTSFLPPPRVDSTVIRLDRHPEQPGAAQREAIFTVVEAAFAERRKTIRNSMRSYFAARSASCGFDPTRVDALLAAAGISPTTRGEALSVETYQALGTALLSFV
jgi:16S rRNA (adenine1518-N6/adenine1519-N6)-dimethyltransferase